MKTRHFFYSLIAIIFVASFLAGCSSIDSHGFVYRQWSSRMSEMGIFPVYPPREDIVVGDVYALPLHPYDTAAVGYIGGLGNAGIHVDYLGDTNLGWTDFLKKIERYYAVRPYPADTTNGLMLGTNFPMTTIPSYPETPVRASAFQAGSTARLRQVSFPDFNISHIDQESLSGVIPIEGIMASLNFNRSDITGVHFSIPHAESYGLTTEELLQEVYSDGDFTNYNGRFYLKGDTNTVISVPGAQMAYAMFQDVLQAVERNSDMPLDVRLHMRKSVKDMTDKIYLALISEVYFARSMDITIERKTASGGSASARPVTSAELQQIKSMGLLNVLQKRSTTTSSTNVTVSSAGTNIVTGTKAEIIDVTEGDSALDLAKKMRDLQTPDGVDNIGASVKVLSASASSIGLRRIFERPICVGVRGVLIKIDVNHPIILAGVPWMKVEGIGH